jgi:Leucine-rich repeat (LRR) protein
MTVLLDITMENVPDLSVLDLSNNNLSALDSLIVLALRFPKLGILHIGRNLTRHVDQLNCLGGLHLEELVLRGNPPYGKYQDKDSYVSEMKKRFP